MHLFMISLCGYANCDMFFTISTYQRLGAQRENVPPTSSEHRGCGGMDRVLEIKK
jgi:hypothetical protein